MTGNNTVSHVLDTLLNSLGLDEEQRQKRMKYQNINQFLSSFGVGEHVMNFAITPFLSGSSFEATTIEGLSSDYDFMYIHKDIRIIADIKDWTGDRVPTYLIDSTGCYRAFVKLVLLSPFYPGPVYVDQMLSLEDYHCVGNDGQIYLSHSITRNDNGNLHGDLHGPAFTTPAEWNVVETDIVFTLQLNSFPREALGWKQRQTPLTRTRIDPSIIDDINHCYLVAVGNKLSPTAHIEWRLSFSHIENKLIRSWNNVQYKCYILMKFIQKDLIKPVVPEALCSYHYKTLIMWMNEEYPPNFFISSHFQQCAVVCLENLVETVRKRYLSHYFVRGCNLFYPKLTNNNEMCQKLVDVIEHIIATWPRCLFNISRCNFGEMFHECLTYQASLSRICSGVYARRRYCGYRYELIQEQNIVCNRYFDLRDEVMSKCTNIFCILSSFHQMANDMNLRDENRGYFDFITKDMLCCTGLEWIKCKMSVSNKTALKNLALGLRCIQKYSTSCCIDTGLKIAAQFVITGHYRQAMIFLDRVQDQIRTYTFFRCDHFVSCTNMFVTSKQGTAVYDYKPDMAEFCKHYYARVVIYTQEDVSHVPKGLVYEMFRSFSAPPVSDPRIYEWLPHAVIHCPVYMHYLRFLIYEEQGRRSHQQVALDNMERGSKLQESHRETNHNIIGHCYRTTGDTRRAYKEYRKSLEIERYNNAVFWHLAVLLRDKMRWGSK